MPPLPTKYRQRNVNLSFQTTVEARLVALNAAYSTRLFFNDTEADPTALDARKTLLGYWLNLRYVSGGVGMKKPTIFQIDCYSSVGTITTPVDQYGAEATEVADDLIAAMSTSDEAVNIGDYSTTPLTPPATAEYYYILNSNGQPGWPENRVRIPNNRGLLIEVVTFHIWHYQDLHGPTAPAFFP